MPMCMRACKREFGENNKCTCRSTNYPGSSVRFWVQASLRSLPCVLDLCFVLRLSTGSCSNRIFFDGRRIDFYPVPSLYTSYDLVVSLASCKRYPIFVPGFFVCLELGFSWLFRSYNSGKTIRSSKYNILGVFKFVMTNDHQ